MAPEHPAPPAGSPSGGQRPVLVTDGRKARRERTCAAVVEALVDLVREGELKPTGPQIAARAGISPRALWSNFSDLEAVYDVTGRVLLARQDERSVDVATDLPLAERIALFCAQRAESLEAIAPFGRANRIREPFSAALRRNRRRFIERIAEEIERTFDAELATTGERRGDHVVALSTCCSWAWWSVLRDDHELTVERSLELLTMTVTGLLDAALRDAA